MRIMDQATWTPSVCTITAFWALFRGFGPLLYVLVGPGKYNSSHKRLAFRTMAEAHSIPGEPGRLILKGCNVQYS